jgi:phosphate transport system protein
MGEAPHRPEGYPQMATIPSARTLPDRVRAIEAALAELADLAVARITEAHGVWLRRDAAGAARVIAADDEVDAICGRVELAVFQAQTLHAPVARDARLLHAARVVCLALERIGDLASAVAYAARVAPPPAPGDRGRHHLDLLGELAIDAVTAVRDSIPDGDPVRARRVAGDAHRARCVLGALVADLCAGAHAPCDGEAVLVGRHLERVCDNAAEITARMTFVTEGRLVHVRAPRGDAPEAG